MIPADELDLRIRGPVVRIRTPPGRAGRLWLMRRLEVAERGYDVLDEKRRALLREEERSRCGGRAERDWAESAAEARRWLAGAALLGGERAVGLARFYTGIGPGSRLPGGTRSASSTPPRPRSRFLRPADGSFRGHSRRSSSAPRRIRRALEAAAALAVARRSHERVAAELERTIRRLQAIERRWFPTIGRLESLELRLDEEEREEALRLRWASRRGTGT